MGFNGRLQDIKPGDPVCIVGRGTANVVHIHARVQRLTKTMIIVEYPRPRATALDAPLERRYRFDGREVGMSDYGGSYVDTVCQRKKKS